MQPVYQHTQLSYATLAGMGIALVIAIVWSVRVSGVAPKVTAAAVGFVLILFSTLTVVVRPETMEVFFGPRLIRRTIPLHSIRDVRVVRTKWYYGWGIRLTMTGWQWNVSGLDAVEIEFDGGRRFRVGSDEPTRLAEVLLRETRAIRRHARD